VDESERDQLRRRSLVADNADWVPFTDDPEAILAVAGRMIDAS
jgi:hypothetical protein